MDINEDRVAPGKVDGMDGCDCAEDESVEDEEGGGGAELMNDITTAMGCAISRTYLMGESARVVVAGGRLEEDQRFTVVLGASAKRNKTWVGNISYLVLHQENHWKTSALPQQD
jgi:hypothetical protein